MPRPSARNLSDATRETFAGIVARQTATLAQRQRAYDSLANLTRRRSETVAKLDAELTSARQVLDEADAELVGLFGLEQAAELTGIAPEALRKLTKVMRT